MVIRVKRMTQYYYLNYQMFDQLALLAEVSQGLIDRNHKIIEAGKVFVVGCLAFDVAP